MPPEINSIDQGRKFDWGRTSRDYATHRPGPPESYYNKLAALGVGLKGQKILDLGTGTGLLARQFARRGAKVSAIDISKNQIKTAQELAQAEGLNIIFKTAPAEKIPFDDHLFDIVTACQCWLYFDHKRVIAEVKRALKPGGWLVTSHLSYLAPLDRVARETERLILKFNPGWTGAGDACEVPACPSWAQKQFNVRAMFYYDEAVRFTRKSWMGRIRACRGVAAELSTEEVGRFDAEHQMLLEQLAPEEFTVLHRIDAHLLEFKKIPASPQNPRPGQGK